MWGLQVPSFLVIAESGEQKLVSSDKYELKIGRLPECEIFLDEAVVSRRHASIFLHDRKYFLKDTGSRNGTLLNSRPVEQEMELCPGDTIGIGSTRIIYQHPASICFDADLDPCAQTVVMSRSARPTSGKPQAPLELLEIVADISRQIAENRPLEGLLEALLASCLEKTCAERAAVLLLDEKGELVPRACHSRGTSHPKFILSRTIAQQAMTEHKAVLVRDVANDADLKMHESVIGLQIASAICTPICQGEETLGLLHVDTSRPEQPLDETDLLFFSTLASMLAEKLKNVILADIALAKHSFDEDLKIAKEIQAHLLPAEIKQIEGYELAAWYHPCKEVGGDYFDLIVLKDGYAIAIGDVAGKGLGPAMLMSNLQAVTRSRAQEYTDPATLLAVLNNDLLGRVGDDRFITFFYLVLQPQLGKLVYANAGQNLPFLLQKSGSLHTLSDGGVPLGIFPESSYQSHSTQLGSGDVLLLYSDGITECFDRTGELFGEDRLKKVFSSVGLNSAKDIQGSILTAVDDFRQGQPYADDRTLLILKKL